MVTEVVDGAKAVADATLSKDQKLTPTYTQEQVDKAIRDAKSAVLADVGRHKAEAERALKAAQDAQARLAQMEKERLDAELEAAKNEPDKMAKIRLQQQLRQKEAELAAARDELNGTSSKLQELTKKDRETLVQSTVKDVATKMGVSAATLGKLAKFTDGTAEAIEEIARDLPKDTTKPSNQLVPDSNLNHGGTPQTKYQIMQDYNSGKISSVQYEEKLKALGFTP